MTRRELQTATSALLAAAPGNAVVAGAGEGLSPDGAMAASPRIPLIQGLPLAGGTGFALPAEPVSLRLLTSCQL